jgi:hypothetical protein
MLEDGLRSRSSRASRSSVVAVPSRAPAMATTRARMPNRRQAAVWAPVVQTEPARPDLRVSIRWGTARQRGYVSRARRRALQNVRSSSCFAVAGNRSREGATTPRGTRRVRRPARPLAPSRPTRVRRTRVRSLRRGRHWAPVVQTESARRDPRVSIRWGAARQRGYVSKVRRRALQNASSSSCFAAAGKRSREDATTPRGTRRVRRPAPPLAPRPRTRLRQNPSKRGPRGARVAMGAPARQDRRASTPSGAARRRGSASRIPLRERGSAGRRNCFAVADGKSSRDAAFRAGMRRGRPPARAALASTRASDLRFSRRLKPPVPHKKPAKPRIVDR